MQLVILGADGKLARVLRSAWPETGAIEPIWRGSGSVTKRIDLRENSAALTALLDDANVVLNLAGVTHDHATRSVQDNVDIARSVLECAGQTPVLLCSSAAVYGDTKSLCHEDMTPAPISAYGHAKAAMERMAQSYSNATCLRIGNVAGTDALFAHVRDHYELHQFANGRFPSRSYIGPHHLALVLQGLATRAGHGLEMPKVLNVAAKTPVTMDALLAEAGKTWTPVPAPETAIEQVHIDTSHLTNLIEIKSPYLSIIRDLNAVKG